MFVTNQQENPCEDSGFSSKNQDAPHLQNICYRNNSQQLQPLLRSSHKDQSLQPNIHHRSQEADDLCPHPPLSLSSTQSQKKKNLRNALMAFSKQPLKSSQHQQTWLHHPAIFFQHQAIIINCTAFLTQINSIGTSISNFLTKGKNNTNQRNTICRNNLFVSYRRIYHQVFRRRQRAFYQQLRRRSNTSQQKGKLMFVINFPHQIFAQREKLFTASCSNFFCRN